MENKNLIVIFSTLIGILVVIGAILSIIHIAVAAVLLLVLFISSYSYVVNREADKPEDPHQHFTESFEVEEKEESFLENTKICEVCNTENNINRKYCKKCQTPIQNITCPVCQTINPHTAKYCSHCDSILQNKTR